LCAVDFHVIVVVVVVVGSIFVVSCIAFDNLSQHETLAAFILHHFQFLRQMLPPATHNHAHLRRRVHGGDANVSDANVDVFNSPLLHEEGYW
jgi:hypothetical protein